MSTDTDAPPYDPRYDEADPFLAPTGPEGPTPPPPRANGHRANPHDTDAEEAVLGAILISTQARDDTFATGLAPHHFYAPHHGAIYDAIAKVDNAGDLPDLTTLSAHLGDSPDVQNRIINLQAGHTWEARNASAYARRVIHMARLRTVMAGAIEAAEHARADNLPAAVSAIEAFIVPEDTSSHGIAHTLLGDFLANDEPDHDWVIPGLLERTDRILLTGPEGGGKSTLLRQIAVQAAAGIHPFTHQEMAPLRVLLLDLENSERQIRRALRPLHVTAGGGADDNLTVAVHPQGLDLNDPTDVATLTHLIAYPLDTIKTRKMARSKWHDVARFEANGVVALTPYLGFFKGFLSILIGNMFFLTVGQTNFFLGVLGEGLLKTWVDMSKISSQMGNK